MSLGSALVTGASRGIGKAIALRLAHDGFDVSVTDLAGAASELDKTVTEIKATGSDGKAIIMDVSKEDDVKRGFQEHFAHFGGIDVMVANAGIAVTSPLVDLKTEDLDRVIDVNIKGVHYCYQAAAIQMIKQGRGGRIIAAASLSSHRAGKWQSAYAASKFAVRGMSQALAQEVAEFGITVNVYSPGVIDTNMWAEIDEDMTQRRHLQKGDAFNEMLNVIPLGRHGKPQDVAGLVSFLASKDSAYMTGQSIVMDGGMWFS